MPKLEPKSVLFGDMEEKENDDLESQDYSANNLVFSSNDRRFERNFVIYATNKPYNRN